MESNAAEVSPGGHYGLISDGPDQGVGSEDELSPTRAPPEDEYEQKEERQGVTEHERLSEELGPTALLAGNVEEYIARIQREEEQRGKGCDDDEIAMGLPVAIGDSSLDAPVCRLELPCDGFILELFPGGFGGREFCHQFGIRESRSGDVEEEIDKVGIE